jgi:hypothetical protein
MTGGDRARWLAPLLAAARAGLVGIPIGLAAFALFWVASALSLGRDVPAARANVAAAFASGALGDEDYRAGDTRIGWHQFNDCLILWQAIDQRGATARLAVTPLSDPHQAETSRCGRLRAFAAGGAAAGEPYHYHRYLHGHTVAARFLLPVMSVEAIRLLHQLTLTFIVLAGIGIGLWGLAVGEHRAESLFWLMLFLAFARWFGLESYGQSLGHGPSDIVHLSFLLFLATAGVRGGIGRRTALLSAGIFGALVMIFEFLTGGIPLGLAAVIGGLPFALKVEERRELAGTIVACLAAFCAAALTCYAAKLALALIVFGPDSLVDTALQLQMRAGLGGRAGETAGLGAIDAAKKLVKGFEGPAAGMPALALGTVALAVLAGYWALRRLLAADDADLRQRALAVLLSNLAIAAMLLLLWQHTLVHFWFMSRVFAWTIGSALALFLLAALRPSLGPNKAQAISPCPARSPARTRPVSRR